MKKPLQDCEKACNRLKNAFIKSLYPDKEDRDRVLDEGYWIGDCVGGVFAWWGWYVDTNNMADYFRYEFTPDEFFDWYDQWKKGAGINMNYYKMRKLKPTKSKMPTFDL